MVDLHTVISMRMIIRKGENNILLQKVKKVNIGVYWVEFVKKKYEQM